MPDSKRYPENEDEWGIILARQNSLVSDVLGDGCKILLVTGEYIFPEEYETLDPMEDAPSIKDLSFELLDDIDLHQLWPEEYEKGMFLRTWFCASIWSPGKFDALLRDIAEDSVRIFFVSVEEDALIQPYDGGVDLILKDQATRDQYKSKYRDWLSQRDDGL